MIRLHRLNVRNFKQLTDVSLAFPDSGTLLIEGHNEAGKSTLFEAIYFALYGKGLSADRLDTLKTYGADEMTVHLEFSVDGRRFIVDRKLRTNQIPTLTYIGAEGKSQTVKGSRAVDQQIRDELRLSAEALLNTCFVEQKELERLEKMNLADRKTAINELLNLRVLTELDAEFKPNREDTDRVQCCRQRVRVAKLDAELPLLETDTQRAHRCLSYAHLLRAIACRDDLGRQIATAREEQASIVERCAKFEQSLAHCESLQRRIEAIDRDLTLRASAWAEAIAVHGKATERVTTLQQLVQTLPDREARLETWKSLRISLQELEGLEKQEASLRGEIGAREAEIAAYDERLYVWQQGEEDRGRLESERVTAQTDLNAAQARLNARQAANRRESRFALLLQHTNAHARAQAEATELERRLNSARDSATRLPELRDRLSALESTEAWIRQNEDRRHTIRRITEELDAMRRRRAEAGTLDERCQQNAQSRAEAERRRETAAKDRQTTGQRMRVGLGTGAVGVVAGAVGAVAHLIVVLGAVGLVLLVIGGMIVAQARGAVTAAITALQEAKSALDTLDGERRALESQQQAIAGRDVTALDAEIARLEKEQTRLQESLGEEDRNDRLSLAVGNDPESLQAALQTAHSEVAACEASADALDDLETRAAERKTLVAEQQKAAHALAVELEVSGEDPLAWAQSAEAARTVFRVEATATPDSVLQEEVKRRQDSLQEIERAFTTLETEQRQRRSILDERPREALESERESLLLSYRETQMAQKAYANVRPSLATENMPTESAPLGTQLAVADSELERARNEAETLPTAHQEQEARRRAAATKASELGEAWAEILPGEPAPADSGETLQRLPVLRAAAESEWSALDEDRLRTQDREARTRHAELENDISVLNHQQEATARERGDWLAKMGEPKDVPIESLPTLYPELERVETADVEGWEAAAEECREKTRNNRSDRSAQAMQAEIEEDRLDLETEREAYDGAVKALEVKRRAYEIVQRTRQSIVSRVMPLTEQNMRQILPLLTEGRYADVQWDEQNSTLAVYDSQARTLVRKRVFSGGARDQISLALRLAFALATLPGERAVRPAWLFLDEPLSSFDRQRTRALVDLLTRGLIRQQFDQIVLISHSESFDPALFDHRLRMEGGRIAESTLPTGTGSAS